MPVSTSWMLARAAQMNAGIAFSASSFVFSFHEPVQSLGSRSRCFPRTHPRRSQVFGVREQSGYVLGCINADRRTRRCERGSGPHEFGMLFVLERQRS
jgi:hypothetical protein